MNSRIIEIKTVTFSEHPVFDFTQSEPCKYDVTAYGLNYPSTFIVNNAFSLDAYCEALLFKISVIEKKEITCFLDYQCKNLNNPSEWLDELEVLIDQNYFYFDGQKQKLKVDKLYMNIQVCRANIGKKHKPLKNQLVNWEEILTLANKVKFDFCLVKFDLEKLDTYSAKKAYLIDIKADFLQAKKICPLSVNKSFETLIDIELDRLEQHKLNPILPSQTKNNKTENGSNIRLNGPSNILIDVFYQFLHEILFDGKPYIDNTPTEVANMIANNFSSKDGKNLSLNTVQTTLSPRKADKRPSSEKRFSVSKLINPSMIFFNMYILDYLNIIDFFPGIN